LYVPSYLGSPTAFDLAVTAPSRQATLGEAARTSLAAASAYAETKAAHLETAAACRGQGVEFFPLVAEATGAWELKAAGFLRKISSAAAAREGADGEGLHAALLQELCVAARIVRAQAVLRRRAELAMATAPPAL